MQTPRYERATGSVALVKRVRGDAYYAKLRLPDGSQIQRKLGRAWNKRGRPRAGELTKKMAEDALAELIADASRGTLAVTHASAPDVVTFADAVAEWLRYVEHDKARRPSTLRDYRNTASGILLPEFGADTPLEQITTQTIDRARERLLAQGRLSRRTIQKALVLLHGVLARAKRLGWIDSNPGDNAERVKVARSGEFAVLSIPEVLAVAAATDTEQDAALIIVAAFTGLRLGELRALRWSDVDFGTSNLRVARNYLQGADGPPKSGKVRSVPLIDQAAKALDQLSRREHFTGADDLVFGSDVGEHRNDASMRTAFYDALARAGISRDRGTGKSLVFHDLRHTFGTLAVQVWPINDVRAYMGHANIATTERYAHHVPRATAAAELTRLVAAADGPQPARAGVARDVPA